MQPHQGEFVGLAEVDFVAVALSGAIGIPVPLAMDELSTSSQSALGAVKGKGTSSWLIKPSIPDLGANLKDWEVLIGTVRTYQVIINHSRYRMTRQMIHSPRLWHDHWGNSLQGTSS
jgi:hypothetical protein